jgi:hypothetical protein
MPDNTYDFSSINDSIEQDVSVIYSLEVKIKKENITDPRINIYDKKNSALVQHIGGTQELGDYDLVFDEIDEAMIIVADGMDVEGADEMSRIELSEAMKEQAIIFGVHQREDSTLELSPHKEDCFDCWQFGFAYVKRNKIEEYGISENAPEEEIRERLYEGVKQELNMLNECIRGNVFSVDVEFKAKAEDREPIVIYFREGTQYYGQDAKQSGITNFVESCAYDGENEGYLPKKEEIADNLAFLVEEELRGKTGEEECRVAVQQIYTANELPENKNISAEILGELNQRKQDFLMEEVPSLAIVDKLCEYTKEEKQDTHFVVKDKQNGKLYLKDALSPDETILRTTVKHLLDKETEKIGQGQDVELKESNSNKTKIKR